MIVPVRDGSVVSEARRRASDLARLFGCGESDVGRIALVATELATNLIKHAGEGALVIGTFDDREGSGIEMLSLDKGPGIADIAVSMEDGYSTAGSPGTGLGAVRRLSDVFAVISPAGAGTAVLARIRGRREPDRSRICVVGAISAEYPGEAVCGDAWAIGHFPDRTFALVADGTGHGPAAAEAATRAVQIFGERKSAPVDVVVDAIHRGLGPTRGAAVAVAEINNTIGQVLYAGVGNIVAALIDGERARRMVSYNGIAGHVAPHIRAFSYPFSRPPTTILHSDGLSSRWDLGKYPGLAVAHPGLIAGILFRDFRRGRDDATVVVVRTEAA